MKSFLYLLFPVLLLTISIFGQTHDVTPWVKKKTVDGKEITILRVPDTQFGSPLVGPVSDVQYLLDRLANYYDKSPSYGGMDIYGNIERDCQNIEKEDSRFPVQYYRDEVKAFKDLKEEMIVKALAQKKADEEKAFFARLKANYAWISGDSLNVRTRPDAKSPSIGKIRRLSYIKAYEVDNNPDWAEINFGEHTGYVLREHVAADWDEMPLSHEDSTRLESGQQHYFTPTAAYTAQLKRAAAAEERAMRVANTAPARKYYTGPRGGCYYLDGKGNKQYVDRSYCR
ncbi:SH3 domain-containing protein [Chitinophaga sp. YR627]|uniref:SH3 domain-containing protein n=1 Tax=Chitinophaga sp. YR627 TaxID=1881041 RepID=UPI0008EC02E4|nr:SH3 domain-containing protein [Chitinophaga sp. YR627]SFM58374.1 SH3 domain-containing protein [Chitinophaga sp. YR627]